MTDFAKLFEALHEGRVACIVVGGLAATIHGSARLTQDVDVSYARSETNLQRMVRALEPLVPYLRGAPPGLPFEWSVATLRAGLNFTLTTTACPLDLLGEIPGGGRYEDLLPYTIVVELFGHEVRCLDLDCLIRPTGGAGRPRDLEAIAELEALREERGA
jgi:hypothetical protein